mmetsp:Transcript_119701/g.298529  ORF Transcript_119701/g.298529 Transcript_119701/m.298529 type:complete len:214 (+) Transcript_119701:727-1368(+)
MLDEDKHCMRVVGPHLVQFLNELIVIHGTTAIRVHDPEDGFEVVLFEVHDRHELLERRIVVETTEQLSPCQAATAVFVHLLANNVKLLRVLFELLLLFLHHSLVVIGTRFQRAIDNERQDDVQHHQVHKQEGHGEEDSSPRALLYERQRDQPPTVTCDQLLAKREQRLHDRFEGARAPVARRIGSARGDPLIDGMDELHGQDRKADQRDHQED